MAVKFANLASTTLASATTNAATSITVSDASSFPSLGGSDYFYASIGEGLASEIVKVTAVSSNTLTATRGQDGTTAAAHSAGTVVALRVVAAALDDIASQAQTAADTESVSIAGDTMTGTLTAPTITSSGKISASDDLETATRLKFTNNITNGWGAPIIFRESAYLALSDYSGVKLGGYNGTSYGPRVHVAGNGNLNILEGNLMMAGTTVIEASRNLTNIGAITSTGDFVTSGIIKAHRGNSNVAAPNTADHTAGTRISFYDTSATSWYAMGIENSTLWFNSDVAYKWYQDGALRMHLNGSNLNLATGALQINGTTRINNVGDGLFTSLYIGSTNIVDTNRNLTNIGTISSGAITSSTGTSSFNELTLTGGSDNLTFTETGGDWSILNAQQSNGIVIYDGTGGVQIHYNNAAVAEFNSNGGMNIVSGELRMGDTTVLTSARALQNVTSITTSGNITGSSTGYVYAKSLRLENGEVADSDFQYAYQMIVDANDALSIMSNKGDFDGGHPFGIFFLGDNSSTTKTLGSGLVGVWNTTNFKKVHVDYFVSLYDSGVTATEYDYLDGVTSNIQTQLNNRYEANDNLSVGTIASGAITASASGAVASFNRTDNDAIIELKRSGSVKGYIGANTSGDIKFYNNTAAGTLTISSAGNLGTTGTISSGAITSTGDIYLNGGNLTRSAHNTGHLEGGHNNIGSTTYKTSPIYTIGNAYNPNDTTLGNMYGIGFGHSSYGTFLSGLNRVGGWGMYVASDGDARIFLNSEDGVVSVTGGYDIGTTNVIDSSRNLTNIVAITADSATLGSATASANVALQVSPTTGSNQSGLKVTNADGGAHTWLGYYDGNNYITGDADVSNGGITYIRSESAGSYSNIAKFSPTSIIFYKSITSDAITSTGDIYLNGGNLTRSAHNTGHLEGSFNNVGANNAKSNPIYTIGSNYNPTDAALSSMYGIGFAKQGDATFLSGFRQSGWGLYVASDGDARVWLNAATGVVASTAGYDVGNVNVIDSSRNITNVPSITLGGNSENQIQLLSTSLINGVSTNITQIEGRQIDFYAYDKINFRTGGGATDSIHFTAVGAERLEIGSGYVDVKNASLRIGGTTAIDSSRNITAGTITSSHSQTDGFKITATDSTANAAFSAMKLDYNLSGADECTTDRNHIGLHLDIDSSASGGLTNHEHRIYGIFNDVRASGDSDLVWGIQSNARVDDFGAGNQITQMGGSYGQSNAHNANGVVSMHMGSYNYALNNSSGTGQVASTRGAYNVAYAGSTSDYNSASYIASHNLTQIGAAQTANISSAVGVWAEIQFDNDAAADHDVTISNAYVFRAEYDENDANDSYTVNTGYLFYGNYAGTQPTTAYGVYIADGVRNYFAGTITAGDGSTTTASYGFNSDLNTGMYSPADHEVGFLANGQQKLKVSGTGIDVTGTLTSGAITSTGAVTANANSASVGADSFVVKNSGVTTVGHSAGMRFEYNTAVPAEIRAVLNNVGSGAGDLAFLTSSDGTSANLTTRLTIASGGAATFAGTISSGGITTVGASVFNSYSASDPDSTSRTNYPAGNMFTHHSQANGVSIIGGQGNYTGSSLTIGEETGRSANFNFIRGISDTNGSPAEEFSINGVGDAVFAGTISSGAITSSAKSTFSGGLDTNTSQSRVKISPWTGTTYGYGMKSGMTFGGLSNNYALTFQMNSSTGRGFWWGQDLHSDAQGAMALTNDGKLTVSHSLRLGYGISDTTTPGATHALDVSGTISSGAITSSGAVQATRFNDAANPTVYFVQPSSVSHFHEIQVDDIIRHRGDTNTYIQLTADRIRLFSGSVEMIDCVEGGTDYVDIIDRVRVTSGGNLECEGNITAYSTTSISDINQKENIQQISDPVEKIKQISGYTFDWKESGEHSGGVIAQEVENVMPSIIKETSIRDSETMKAVDYQAIIGLLVETVKDLNQRIEDLENGNN